MSMGWMPVQAPMTIAQAVGQGTNMMQQYTANALANQAQQILNQYQPNLLQNQVTQGQITNQYLPQLDQAQINYQNALTQFMPMQTLARMYSGLGSLGKAQAYTMLAQMKSPLVGQNGVAPGVVQGSLDNANFLNLNPISMMQMLQKGQNPQGYYPATQQITQSASALPTNQATSQLPIMQDGQPQSAPQQTGSNGIPQGYMLRNGITGAYTDSNNNIIQPETLANQTFDQRGIAAMQRVNDQIPDLIQGAQFQNLGTDTQEELQGLANRLGGNYSLPAQKAAYESALETIPESMLKAYGLNSTNELYTAMKEAIAPKDGESPIQYANRVRSQQYMFQNFVQQAGGRLSAGMTLSTKDYDPSKQNPSSVMINGTSLSSYMNYADKNKLNLTDLVSTKFPPSEIDAYATKYKMTPQQVIQLIQQKQGAANAGS